MQKFYMPTRTLAKKGNFIFLQEPMQKRDKPILKTYKANHEHREKKNNSINQNHRKPKRKRKTLKPIPATRQNQPEFMPAKKTPPNEKAENLKTCLLRNI